MDVNAIKPIGCRLLIRQEAKEENKIGSLYIPDTAKTKPEIGLILAVGTSEEALQFKAGEKIIYGKYTGNDIRINGEDYILMHTDDILAKIEE